MLLWYKFEKHCANKRNNKGEIINTKIVDVEWFPEKLAPLTERFDEHGFMWLSTSETKVSNTKPE